MTELAADSFPELGTQRLRLREITAADAEDLLAIWGDASLMRYFGSDPLKDIEAAHDLVRTFSQWRLDANPGIRWAVQGKDGRTLLGTCGFFKWNREWRKCSVGYEMAAHAHGRGYMREALAAALAWAFDNMGLNRIEALIHPDNRPSIRLAVHLGFIEEGRMREAAYWGGRFHDMLQFSLLRRDFSA